MLTRDALGMSSPTGTGSEFLPYQSNISAKAA
jgi:hypothetical protein